MLHNWPGHIHLCLSLSIWHEWKPPNALFHVHVINIYLYILYKLYIYSNYYYELYLRI